MAEPTYSRWRPSDNAARWKGDSCDGHIHY